MGQLILRSVGGVDQPALYTVDLLNGDYANIVRGNGGWTLIIHPKDYSPYDRGLFSTPNDALAVLEAEVNARILAGHSAAYTATAQAAMDRRQQASVRHAGSRDSSQHDRRKAI
jgi:hypothetical protein